jgi:hypothetical protein
MKPFLSALVFVVILAALSTAANATADIKTTPVGDPEVREFARNLCRKMTFAGETGKDIVKTMEDQLLGYMKITRDTPNYTDKIIEFWNANKNDFICKGKVDSATRETEHLMKRAIALSLHNHVLYKFLLNHPNTDVNAIEYVDGEPETVVDYLNKILANPDASKKFVISDIEDVREMLIDYFNAKTAAELADGEGK